MKVSEILSGLEEGQRVLLGLVEGRRAARPLIRAGDPVVPHSEEVDRAKDAITLVQMEAMNREVDSYREKEEAEQRRQAEMKKRAAALAAKQKLEEERKAAEEEKKRQAAEKQALALYQLIILVPFACHQDQITRTGSTDCRLDCSGSIRLNRDAILMLHSAKDFIGFGMRNQIAICINNPGI